MNLEKVKKLLETIRKHQQHFDMGNWFAFRNDEGTKTKFQLEDLTNPSCKTLLCIGGFCALLRYPRVQLTMFEDMAHSGIGLNDASTIIPVVAEYLECTEAEALFMCLATVDASSHSMGEITDEEIAIGMLEELAEGVPLLEIARELDRTYVLCEEGTELLL